MCVLGYTWAGVRAADLKSAARFFADVLGFSLIHEDEGIVQFELPSGQLFEVFGSKSRYYWRAFRMWEFIKQTTELRGTPLSR